MSKTVKVFNTQTNSVITVESNATNWKELKEEILNTYESKDVAVDLSKMTAVAKTTNNKFSLEFDDTIVPEEEIKVYLMPTESKSGWEPTVAIIKEVRTKMKKLTDHYEVESENFVDELEAFFADILKENVPAKVPSKNKELEEKNEMQKEADEIRIALNKNSKKVK